MKFFKKPLLLAVTAFTLLGATGCSNDSLSTGTLLKAGLVVAGAGAGAAIGSQLDSNNPMLTTALAAGVGGVLGFGLGSIVGR